MESMQPKKPATMPSWIAYVVIGILVVLILIFLYWGLHNFQQIRSRDESIQNNPYCYRAACDANGNQIDPATGLTPINDPQRFSYETLNYCLVNAPPCGLIDRIATMNAADLTALATFYNNEYVPRCAYLWTGSVDVAQGKTGTAPGEPNSTELKCGPNDPIVTAIISRSKSNDLKLYNSTDSNNIFFQLCQKTLPNPKVPGCLGC
jgi:hypothetical protein